MRGGFFQSPTTYSNITTSMETLISTFGTGNYAIINGELKKCIARDANNDTSAFVPIHEEDLNAYLLDFSKIKRYQRLFEMIETLSKMETFLSKKTHMLNNDFYDDIKESVQVLKIHLKGVEPLNYSVKMANVLILLNNRQPLAEIINAIAMCIRSSFPFTTRRFVLEVKKTKPLVLMVAPETYLLMLFAQAFKLDVIIIDNINRISSDKFVIINNNRVSGIEQINNNNGIDTAQSRTVNSIIFEGSDLNSVVVLLIDRINTRSMYNEYDDNHFFYIQSPVYDLFLSLLIEELDKIHKTCIMRLKDDCDGDLGLWLKDETEKTANITIYRGDSVKNTINLAKSQKPINLSIWTNDLGLANEATREVGAVLTVINSAWNPEMSCVMNIMGRWNPVDKSTKLLRLLESFKAHEDQEKTEPIETLRRKWCSLSLIQRYVKIMEVITKTGEGHLEAIAENAFELSKQEKTTNSCSKAPALEYVEMNFEDEIDNDNLTLILDCFLRGIMISAITDKPNEKMKLMQDNGLPIVIRTNNDSADTGLKNSWKNECSHRYLNDLHCDERKVFYSEQYSHGG